MSPEEIRQIIREEIAYFAKTDKFIFEKLVVMAEGRHIQTGRGEGTMIGTEGYVSGTDLGQKIAFFGKTPIPQYPTGYLIDPSGGATIDSNARGAINDIHALLRAFGFSKT